MSLIELLVVIAIMLVVMTLITGATFKAINWLYHSNTDQTMKKVYERLTWRYQGLRREARDRDPGQFAYAPGLDPFTLAGIDSLGGRRRGRVIFHKYLYKWSFPMNFAEMQENANSGYPPAVALWKSLQGKLTNPSAHQPETEPAACLFLIYEQLAGGASDNLTPSELQDTDGDGVRELCDGWGTPFRFYRWPLADLRVMYSGGWEVDKSDPQDPEYTLLHHPWANTPSAAAFEKIFHDLQSRQWPAARYTTLVVVSAGPDRKFGLVIPPGPTTTAPDPMRRASDDELDNLYSYRLRLAVQPQ
jgi:type II secretory pathway pseudopilin PulG